MKFPGGMNIQQMMKQAQAMQEKMAKEMDELRVDASSGGGVVSVQMRGNHEIESLKTYQGCTLAVVYKHSNFQGTTRNVQEAASRLGTLADEGSSLKFFCNTTTCNDG